MAAEELFVADDISYTEALAILENNNLSQTEINTLMWGILGESIGRAKRVFKYSETFPAEAPECQASFSRSFVHTDWIDGESVVQAEQNSIEEGFNLRFHNIETDLDALASDIRKAFTCIGVMRSDLAARLTELHTEINKINSDVFDCCQGGSGSSGVGPVYPGYYYHYQSPVFFPPYVTEVPEAPVDPLPGGPLGPWVRDKPWIAAGPVYGGDRPWARPATIGDWLRHIGETTYPGPAVTRSANDPSRATVAGMPARRLDVQNFNGQIYEVWSTSSGIVMTPAETGVTVHDQAERSWTGQRSKTVGDVSEWMASKTQEIAAVFRRGANVGNIVEKFGDDRLDGGLTLRDALAALPTATRLEQPGRLLDLLSERAASAIARDGLAAETLVANVGFNKELDDIAKVPMKDFKAVPVAAREALIEAGIETLGEFQNASPGKITEILTGTSAQIDLGTAARWSGEAMVVGKLAGLVR